MDLRQMLANAAVSPPDPPASPSTGYPTNGNPGTGTPPGQPGAYWFHQIAEELRNVIVNAGLTPDDEDLDQLWTALLLLPGRTAALVEDSIGSDSTTTSTSNVTTGLQIDHTKAKSTNPVRVTATGVVRSEDADGSGTHAEITLEYNDGGGWATLAQAAAKTGPTTGLYIECPFVIDVVHAADDATPQYRVVHRVAGSGGEDSIIRAGSRLVVQEFAS